MGKELYLLPYAGGSSLSYSRWNFVENIKAIPLDYKGHGVRLREKLDSTFKDLVDDVTNVILNQTEGKDVNIFGHSMGCLVAWDVVNNLINEGIICRNLIVSACVPPHLFNFGLYKSLATEDGLLNFIRIGKRLSENQINSKIFREVLGPASINDYRLLSEYRRTVWSKAEIKIACLYGDCDSMIDKKVIDKWQEYSTKEIWKKEFVGGHYYIEEQENLQNIEIIINKLLCKIA